MNIRKYLKHLSAILVVVSSAAVFPVQAQLTVTNLLQYQVIQRDTNSSTATYTVTGTCRAGTDTIRFNLSNQTSGAVIGSFSWVAVPTSVTGTTWSATLSGLPIGGEYSAKFRAINGSGTITDSTAAIPHLLVGDIWLCAGQSNMQVGGPSSNPDPVHIHVRVVLNQSGPHFNTNGDTSHWGNGYVMGPCMSFGSTIYTKTGVPVGIIYSAAGGTMLNSWDTSLFVNTKTYVKAACNWKIGGFLWYQGEAEDTTDTFSLQYQSKFDTIFLSHMRTPGDPIYTGNSKLPACAVQLESWTGTGTFGVEFSHRVRWPVTRDRQELIGREPYGGCAPIWDAAGLHISSAEQAVLGPRCAARMINLAYSNLAPHQPSGPLFKQAWFQDSTRTHIVVQFMNVTGRITNPADPYNVGFYVMRPDSFRIDDSLAFMYSDTLGRNPPMILKISSVDTMGTDKVVITLTTPVPDSLTVGYGRGIYLGNLTPVTDSSGIPLCTFFNRPIAAFGAAPVHETQYIVNQNDLTLNGTTLRINGFDKNPVFISLFNVNGRLIRKFSTMQRTINFRNALSRGYYLLRADVAGRRILKNMIID